MNFDNLLMKHRGGSMVGNVLEKALGMLPLITHAPNPICSTGLNVDSLAGIQVEGWGWLQTAMVVLVCAS